MPAADRHRPPRLPRSARLRFNRHGPRIPLVPGWPQRPGLLARALAFLRPGRAAEVWAALAAVAYLTLLSSYLITHGSWPTPDILVPPLLFIALLLGRPHTFLIDWAPFLGLWLCWQWLAGEVAPANPLTADITGPLEAERRLFRIVPTVALQMTFFLPGRLAWYDWAAAFIHGAHFVVPVGVAFALWVCRRTDFWRLAVAVLAMSYLGLIIYWQYPAAPPWMAAEQGVMGQAHVWRILGETLGRFPVTEPLGYAYQRFAGNPVAAMPSLHAALPLTITLVLWRLRPAWAPVAMLYSLLMAPALVYLGEHYVVDIVAGWGVAVAAFLLGWLLEVVGSVLRPAVRLLIARRRRLRVRPRPTLRLPPAPVWWGATRGALYPGLPLLAGLLLLVGPLGYRPSHRLAPLPPPPPCALFPSTEVDAVAASARERLGPVVLFVVEAPGILCHWADPDRVLIEPDTARSVRLAALHRLATDPATLWDPVVPEGALTVRREVETLGADETARAYAVLLLVLQPSDLAAAREQAEPLLDEAAAAARRTGTGASY